MARSERVDKRCAPAPDLLGLSAILAIALVVYALTDWPAAARASVVATLVLVFVGIAFRFVWTGDDFDDIDVEI